MPPGDGRWEMRDAMLQCSNVLADDAPSFWKKARDRIARLLRAPATRTNQDVGFCNNHVTFTYVRRRSTPEPPLQPQHSPSKLENHWIDPHR